MRLKRLSKFLPLLAVLAIAPSCGHNPLAEKLDQPEYQLDNSLPFQPKRIWRLLVRWEPYLLNSKKALLVKEFRLVVRDTAERNKLEQKITSLGGDARYLNWFESELFPLGNWEQRDQARVARYADRMTVVFVTKAVKEVSRIGRMNVLPMSPVQFPDPLFRAFKDQCPNLSWDVIASGESVGTEIILQSRSKNPSADKWTKIESELSNFSWKSWSVGQGQRISYRTAIFVKSNIARCPLPPKVFTEVERLSRLQPMGIDW